MLSLFRRTRAEDATLEDLRQLCEQGAEEGHTLEFKESVPDNVDENGENRWTTTRNISDKAKRAVLKAVIALANADGGWLVLGVREDSQDRAAKLEPIEDCVSLADRLGRVLASSIEPPLPVLGSRGIEFNANGGAGAVVIGVGPSLLRPHRIQHGDKRHVYVRRGKESLEMSMWDIQSLTLETGRRVEKLEARLSETLGRYERSPSPKKPVGPIYGYAIAAAPLISGPVIEDIYRHTKLFSPQPSWNGRIDATSFDARSTMQSEWGDVTPMLRGARRLFHPTINIACCLEVGWDGNLFLSCKFGYEVRTAVQK